MPHSVHFHSQITQMDTDTAAPEHQRSFTTHGPLILFCIFVAVSVIGLCASAAVRKRKIRSEECRNRVEEGVMPASSMNSHSEGIIKKVMVCSSKWGDENGVLEPVKAPGSVEKGKQKGSGGMAMMTATTTTPPLWQRRILMGERCELPRFSGLILYDEHGCPLKGNNTNNIQAVQERPAVPVTTLKDLF